jgi:hypothetical protein
MICEDGTGWREIIDHDVEREWALFSELSNQFNIDQSRCEEPIGTGLGVRVRPLDRLNHHGLVMTVGWCLEKDIGPSI